MDGWMSRLPEVFVSMSVCVYIRARLEEKERGNRKIRA